MDLPDDVIYVLLKFCDVKTLGRLAQVCRRLSALVSRDCVWLSVKSRLTCIVGCSLSDWLVLAMVFGLYITGVCVPFIFVKFFDRLPVRSYASVVLAVIVWLSICLSHASIIGSRHCAFCQAIDSQSKSVGLVLGLAATSARSLHSSNEPGELSQWLCHDDSTINIISVIIIIIIIIIDEPYALPLSPQRVAQNENLFILRCLSCLRCR